MVQKICEKITNLIIKEGIEDESQRDVLLYGSALLISNITNILVVLFIGMILSELLNAIVFFFFFILLREQTGGYHAGSPLGCNTVLGINTVIALLIIKVLKSHIQIALIVSGFIAAFSLYIFYRYAPKEHRNKNLSENSKTLFKRRSIVVWGISVVFLSLLLLHGHTELSLDISMSLISVSVALLF